MWSFFLSLAVLCAQDVKLHSHDIQPHHSAEASNHAHLSKAHFAHDSSHKHHNSVVFEVDITPDGVLKSLNNNVFVIALFTLFFTLMAFISSRQLVQRCRESKLILHRYYLFSPPLRAPPQY